MSTVGYSTLDVIPSVKNLRSQLERQTAGDFAAAGRKGGQQFGDAAGKEASGRIKSRMSGVLREVFAPVAGLAAGAGIVEFFKGAIDEAEQAAKVSAITAQLIKSTGGAANLSAKQVGDLATSMEKYAAIDDEVVQAGENILLTFRGVRNEVGAGNDIFTRATKASLDLSTVLDGDLKTSALQLGKALQDPVLGMTALRRAGVNFTAAQKEQVKAFVASNDLLSAQKLILSEVEHQVGGAAGANATALDRMKVSFKDFEEAVGVGAAPALDEFFKIVTNQVIPGLEHAGGPISDVTHAFDGLPTPIKAATGALVAFKIAQATGVTSGIASGFDHLGTGLAQIEIRAKNAASAFRTVRSEMFVAGQAGSEFSGAGTRMAASLEAIRAASFGAGAGLQRGLKGALSLVGGAWGAAFIAGTAVVAHFWQEHQQAKQRVEDFTATLDKETGALTANSREFVVKQLLDDGVLKSAQRLGLSLSTVTDAALGQWQAIATLNSVMGAKGQLDTQAAADAIKVKGAIDDTNGVVGTGVANQELFAAALGDTASNATGVVSSTGQASAATASYATELDKAKAAIRGLLDIENKRRNAQLTIRQDRLALIQQEQAARKEAEKGAKTLDINTKAGQDNQQALFDLASQWNNSAESVKNAKGAYADFRQQFVNIATSMGDTKAQAQKLADQILNVPRRVDTDVRTPGMKAALRDLAELRAQLAAIHDFKGERFVFSVQAGKNQAALSDIRKAGGGPIYGPGSGTSDSVLMWGSNGEFMQRKAAVDHYGLDFMNRINNLQVPKYAGGGPVGSETTVSMAPIGHELRGTLAIDRDGIAYIRGVVRSEIESAETARLRTRRLSPIGGIPQ